MKQWLRSRLGNPGIRRQLWGLFALLLVAGATVLVVDEIAQARAQDSLLTLQDDALQRMRRLKAVSDAYGLDVVDTTFRARNTLITWNEGVAVVRDARAAVDTHWGALAAMPRNPRQQRLFDEVAALRVRADRAIDELERILLAQDATALAHFADTELYAAIDPVTARLQQLSDLAMLEAERVVREDVERQRRVSLLRTGITIAVLLLVAWLGQRLLRTFYAKTRAEVAAAEAGLNEQLARNEAVRDELARRELFLRSLLDAAQVAIMALDHEGRWSVFNPAAERLLGWRADEVVGRLVRYGDARPGDAPLLVTPKQVEHTAAWLREKLGRHVPDDWRALYALADLRQPPAESRLLHRDGREVPVLLALSAFDDAEGRRAGMIAVAADLSRIKRLEGELRDSEARAQAANQAKSAFLATMSHEIRTPMIGVTGMLEVLAHSKLDGDQRHALNVIQQSAQSLLQVVGDILDFSKIEAGRLDLVAVPTDLGRLLRGAVANFSGAASSKGLKLSATVDKRVAPAHLADPMRLRQVLANGLSNAIKFTPSGSIEAALEYEGTTGDGAGERLCFRVTDTGIGIDPARQALLFQPFAQAEGDTSRHYGGTGLGLAISRHLAELMGGELELDSAPGRGTTLRLRVALPRANPDDVAGDAAFDGAPAGAVVARPLPTTAQSREDGTLVLLVDDHPTNRLVIARQLALAGFASEAANDGNEGLARWRSGRYGLVLSDVHMPGLDGYALARAIRAEEAETGRKRTPIVALTAAALKGEAERCLAAGMDDYLAKPVPVATLAACLQRWLPQAVPAMDADGPAAIALPQLGHPPAFDPAVLAALTGGDDAAGRQVLDDFLATTADDLAALEAARGAGEAPALATQALRIKGSARLVGAVELAACADMLETAARGGDWDALLPLAEDLQTAAQRLRLLAGSGWHVTMPP